MYKAFNITNISDGFNEPIESLHDAALVRQRLHDASIRKALQTLLKSDGVVDGALMQGLWFPQIKADVFISHSHVDETKALNLSGLLKKRFGLTAFVDSSVWGNADELLRQIDDAYCLKSDGSTYSYDRRNGTTSHVHMMLMVALMKMIDATECVFFLNTPNSTTVRSASTDTNSSWIYGELALVESIRRRYPREHLAKSIKKLIVAESLEKTAHFKPFFPLNVATLPSLSGAHLDQWKAAWSNVRASMPNTSIHPLDLLYFLAGL